VDRPVAVACHHGMRSMQAVAWLRRNGYENVTNLAGGVDAWARQIDPSMSTY
jgi:rhodanese-related sulfurtransferase